MQREKAKNKAKNKAKKTRLGGEGGVDQFDLTVGRLMKRMKLKLKLKLMTRIERRELRIEMMMILITVLITVGLLRIRTLCNTEMPLNTTRLSNINAQNQIDNTQCR